MGSFHANGLASCKNAQQNTNKFTNHNKSQIEMGSQADHYSSIQGPTSKIENYNSFKGPDRRNSNIGKGMLAGEKENPSNVCTIYQTVK